MEIIQAHANSFGATVNRFELKDVAQFDSTFDLIAKGSPDAILVVPDAALFDLREQIASNALKHRIPLISTIPELTDAGALIGYGAPRRGLYRRAGYFVKRILDGTKPGDLPVEQPGLIEFSINSKTAILLGIRIPDALLARADRVIE
jgi:putative ABC transport system substrate-binding protein